MRYFFDERKTAQAAAYLIQLHGGQLNYMVLIKLLYLADRESWIENAQPITGDSMVSMPHGPVLSRILDLINMGKEDSREWFNYITESDGFNVSSVESDPQNDELSRYELKLLNRINDQFGNLNKWALRDYTHTLPEWEDPNGSSYPISPVDILKDARSPEEIKKIAKEAEEIWFLRTMELQAR